MDQPNGSDVPEGVEVEHEPTISFLPDVADHPTTAEERLHGAFGFALVVEKGPRAGMAYVLAPGKTTVGRSPDSSIFLDDVTVSRDHAAFILDGGSLRVVDEGSTNGTYVNRTRVDDANLEPGDEVIIGKYHLIVARGDE